MLKRIVSGFLLTLLLLSMLMLAFDVRVNALELVDTITLDKATKNIAVNEQTNMVYISVGDGIIVLDGNTRKIVAEINLNYSTTYGLIVNPQTNRIFISVLGKIFVINGDTNQVIGEILETIDEENEIVINPVTNLLYIANISYIYGHGDYISVYNGDTLKENTSIYIPYSSGQSHVQRILLAINPRINRIYATYSVNDTIYAIDGNTHEIINTANVDYWGVLYGCNPFTNYVYAYPDVYDGETLCPSIPWFNVTDGFIPRFEVADPLYNRVYYTQYKTIYVVDGYTNEELSNLTLDVSIKHIAINPKTGDIYALEDTYALNDTKLFVLHEPIGPTTRTYTPYAQKVEVSSNSSISEFQFNGTTKQISFKVIGANGTNGFCNITFPSDLLWGTISIYKDGLLLVKDVDYTQTYNATHYTFNIVYNHSTHTIEILGTEAIPEFPITCMLLLFIASMLLAVIACKRKHSYY